MMQKKIYKPEEFKMPTDAEIMQDVEEMFEFLKLTHPYMEDRKELIKKYPPWETDGVTAPDDIVLEIRALKRSPKDTNSLYLMEKGCEFGQSLKLYNLQESSKPRLFKYLKEKYRRCIKHNTYFCLYYSVFCYNDEIIRENLKSNNKRFNCAATNNVAWTQILVADFDDITEIEFVMYKKRLEDLGLGEALVLMSGHGYQMVWLLDNITIEKDVLERLTETLISRGFRVDAKIKDCARIMRLIASWNSKGMSLAYKKLDEELIRVEWLQKTKKRYDKEYIFNTLKSLEIQNTPYYKTFLENKEKDRKKKEAKEEQEAKKVEIKEAPIEDATVEIEEKEISVTKVEIQKEKFRDEVNIDELQRMYKTLDIESLPQPIQRMLLGLREGKANNTVYFLTQFLKSSGYNKLGVIDAILMLVTIDKFGYAWDDEEEIKGIVDRAWDSESTPVKLYTEHLKEFGYIDFERYYKITINERVKINNKIFEDLKHTEGTAFYIYICLIVHYARFGSKSFTVNDIIKITNLSEKTVRRHVKNLQHSNEKKDKLRKVYKTKAKSTKLGDKHTYTIDDYVKKSKYFTSFNISTLDSFCLRVRYKELNDKQMAICLYLRYRAYIEANDCIVTQSEIAKDLGISRSRVSTLMKPLEELGLIRLKEIKLDDYRFIYDYILQY